jgi:hypothetical protein
MSKLDSKNEADLALDATRKWLETFVIGLSICPFAAKPYKQNKVRLAYFDGSKNDWINGFEAEIRLLESGNIDEIETTLWVFPDDFWEDFHTMWDETILIEDMLDQLGLEDNYQLAYFHPNFEFEGIDDKDDIRHFVHRSPYPIVHILRWDSIAIAEAIYPNIEEIPAMNDRKLNIIGIEQIKKMLHGLK